MSMDAIPVDHDPFGSGEIARISPSTEPQREVIAAAAMSADANTAYNEAVSLRLSGDVDVDAVERALSLIVDRHDALRTTFTPQLDALVVTGQNRFVLERTDLTMETPERQSQILLQTWREVSSTPMDLCEGPLFRAIWLHYDATDGELVLLAHHAICDGWSFHVILRELSSLYTVAPSALSPAPSFAAFAEQQQAREVGNRDADYWLRRFADKPAALDLPTDRPRPSRRTFAAHRIDYSFSQETTKALAAAAGRMRASSVGVLLAGVASLMHRLTDQDDITLGMPVARQSLAELPELVGHCVQLLPIRLKIDDSQRFEQLVMQARSAVLDATEHFDFTFGGLVRGLGLSGDAARVPLIPVLVNVDQPLADLPLGGAIARVRTVPRTAEGFEIFLNVLPSAANWVVEATFNSDLFADETISAWLQALENLLLAGASDPATLVRSLGLVKGAADAYGSFNSTAKLVVHPSWVAAFLAQAQRSPHSVAVTDSRGSMTYAELAARARALAGELLRRGVRRGSVVGISMVRGRDLVVAMAGIHLAGAAHLPLDPAFPEARLQYMIADAGATLVVADAALPEVLLAGGVGVLDMAAVADSEGSAARVFPVLEQHDLAYVIYTSGSTGRPKGVRVQHGALSNLLASAATRPGFATGDTLLAITTISFDISLLELLLPLTVGGRVAVARREEAEDPRVLASLLKRHAVTVMQATPATWRMLVDDQWPGLATLRAFCGGERLQRDLAAALLPRVGSLWNLYGPTETCIWSVGSQVVASETASLVGRPFDNSAVYILDRAGTLLPSGMPGEICIGGLGLAEGYHNLPHLTAERFFNHIDLGRLYKTGDRGRVLPSGALECLGRLDHQVKVRGFRIELGEIEAVLATHPAVADAVAIVADDPDGARTVAYVVSRSGPPSVEELRTHLRSFLPVYMVPQHIVTLSVLPRLPTGKVDRRALPKLGRLDVEVARYTEPSTPLERQVATAMAGLLGIERFGAEQDFFDAGGHSLLAAQLVARLNRECDADLSMRTVFEMPTPRGLARAIAQGAGSTRAAGRRIARRSEQQVLPVTLVQERIWFMEQMLPGRPTYNLPSAHRLRGPFDEEAFRKALQEIVRRQSVLRTTFERRGGRLAQIVHDNLLIDLPPIEDLSGLPASERETRLVARLEELTAKLFNLDELPLYQTRLFRLAPEEHVWFFMPHHIIWDGWSFDILYQEMAAIYSAAIRGLPSQLPELPISYGDFAAWHRELLASQAAEQQAKVWRERLRRFGPVAPLPVDHKRGHGMSGQGATEWISIDARRTHALHELGRERGATMFVTTLAIYVVLLHDYAKESRLLLATPIRGRESVELESVMGCCNSLLPLALEVQPKDTFESTLSRVKSAVLNSLADPDVMLEQIVGSHQRAEGAQHPVGASSAVLYQALFSFQDVRRREIHWGELQHSMIQLFQKGATEDLGLWFIEDASGLHGGLTHNLDVLTASTVRRLSERFVKLVDVVIENPSVPVSSLTGAIEWRPPVTSNPDVVALPRAGAVDLPAARGAVQEGRRTKRDLSDVELVLAGVWKRVLGVERVDPFDNFFDLGGNSLGVLNLLAEVERSFQVVLDPAALFRSPTIASLAAAIAAPPVSQRSGLTELRRGGARKLFLVHDGEGQTLLYLDLARCLPRDVSVYGVEPRALPRVPLACTTIEKMAAHGVECLRRLQPTGPYLLGGLCAGGLIAYEMAVQLQRLGERVEFLAILDAGTPQAAVRAGYQFARRRERFARAVAEARQSGMKHPLVTLKLCVVVLRKAWGALAWALSSKLRSLFVRARVGLLDSLLRRGKLWPSWLPLLDFRDIYQCAELRYVPAKLAGVKVALVRATAVSDSARGDAEASMDDTPYVDVYEDPTFGWESVAEDLIVMDVKGGHSSMLRQPYVESMAAALGPLLAGAADIRVVDGVEPRQ